MASVSERSVAIPLQYAKITEYGTLDTQMSREQLEQLPEYEPERYVSVTN